MNYSSFLSFLFLFLNITAFAQDDTPPPMRVVHCSAVDQVESVQNIFVDENNTKWVGAASGLYQIHSADNSSFESFDRNELALLRQRGGNAELTFNTFDLSKMSALQSFMPETDEQKDKISAAFYDKKNKTLWIGTTDSGLYAYKVNKDGLRFLKHYTTDNSKLKSNQINAIFVDRYSRQWIGTDNGVMYGENDKFKVYEKGTEILAIAADKTNVWLLGEKILWKIDKDNRWTPGDLDPRFSRGKVRDIAYDSDSKLWIASDIIVRYDVVEDIVEVFDENNGFKSKKINCIMVDEDDALWVGTEDQGMYLIEKESAMTVTCIVDKALSCAGSKDDASLLVKVIGGTPPYQYAWKNEFVGNHPQNVGPGFYTVMVTDTEGLSKMVSANIEDERLKVRIISEGKETKAGAKNGRAELKVTGGKPNYKFRWDNGETAITATRLQAGKHQVTVSDRAGCKYIAVVTIDGNPETIASTTNPSASNLNIDFEIDGEATCAGDANTSIQLKVSGGDEPYTYIWNDKTLKGDKVKGLSAGNYTVTVKDASGNNKTQDFYLQQPDALRLVSKMEQAVSNSRKPNGIASVKVSGGNPPYSYAWDNGSNTTKAERLDVGTHQLTVTDASACTLVGEIQISKQINSALTNTRFRPGQTIRLRQLNFEADSVNINASSILALDEIYNFMLTNPTFKVEIGGHTNNVPLPEYCDKLSTERAKSVADYIIMRGISKDRIVSKGYGKRKPLFTNKTEEGRRKNQRVEVKILSM